MNRKHRHSEKCSPVEPPAEKKQLVGRLLHKSSRFFRELAAQRLAQAGYAHIWIGHIVLMLHIRPGGSTINQLAQETSISKQAVSRFVKELETNHYVSTGQHPDDARSVLVGITASGHQLLAAWQTATDRAYQQFIEIVGEKSMQELVGTLDKLVTFFEEPPTDSAA
ncbi:MarR family winged helix-turn-helix transcriptional regulator [Larkinella insperata]|uniref:MarR family winged helix-turn-helix transcriptional regulator n=1 Tax=Larkinella insperata TaxID=332158 RepID=A0ABW3Q248_9BACT|nr:MarR family winged helix-turn-helix transcriptional regulator [Larkinella insperata]